MKKSATSSRSWAQVTLLSVIFLMADIWSPPSKGCAGVLMMHAGLLPWLNGTCGGTKPPVLSQVKKISVQNFFWFKSLINHEHGPSCFCPALDELIYKEKKERWGFFFVYLARGQRIDQDMIVSGQTWPHHLHTESIRVQPGVLQSFRDIGNIKSYLKLIF